MVETRVLMFRPYIFLSRVAGEWDITFDWDDCYQGYEDGFDFNPFTPEDPDLRTYVDEGNEFLSRFLNENATFRDVAPY